VVDLVVVPSVTAAERRALAAALERAGMRASAIHGYETAWRRSALREAVDRGEPEDGYALSPRSTRGATRA
jgi:hypothetical protein